MGLFDSILDAAFDKPAEHPELIEKLETGTTFLEEMVNTATGTNVFHTGPNITMDGVHYSPPGKAAGAAIGKKINTVVSVLTPDEWKNVASLMYKVASYNIPALAVIDWNRVAEIADELTYKSIDECILDNIDWRNIAQTLINQQAVKHGVPVGVVKQIIDSANKVLASEGEEAVFYIEADLM